MLQKILVICTGNICRSPVGAALLAARLPDLKVMSAGLGALVGKPVDPAMMELAERDGLNVSDHRARQIDGALCREAELILVMTDEQRRAINERYAYVSGKVMLYGHWLEKKDIPDPYRKSRDAFVHVHDLLSRAADAWQQKLSG